MSDSVTIRAVPVDTLISFTKEELTKRQEQVEQQRDHTKERCDSLREELSHVTRLHAFLVQEYENAVLAQKLQRGDVVRVVCPVCKGSGMSPDDVTGGRIRGSAFENIGDVQEVTTASKPCKECEGKQWVLMDRFKG